MTRPRAILFAAVVLLLPGVAQAARDPNRLCQDGVGKAARQLWNQVVLRVTPTPDKRESCTAEIVASDGGVVFARDENSFVWNNASGKDINGDDQPDLVLEAFTGGAHCCWKYWIFSFGPDPMLVGRIENDEPVAFGFGEKGRIVLHTVDEAFNNFDGLCYACSPRANLYFTLNGDQFKDVTAEFAGEASFAILRKRLETLPVDQFRKLASTQDLSPELTETKAAVLNLVLAYLYSGHEDEAWKALQEFWPKGDVARVKPMIAAARAKGTLKMIGDWNRDHMAE